MSLFPNTVPIKAKWLLSTSISFMKKVALVIFLIAFLNIGVYLAKSDSPTIKVFAQNSSTKKIVVLDPGHCSNDKYGENKVPENTLNIMQANALAGLLNSNGYDAKVYNPNGDGSCNEPDYYQNLQSRVDFANSLKASLYISIHADSGEQNDKFNPIYSQNGPFSSESLRFAGEIGRAVVQALSAQDRYTTFEVTESRSTGIAQGDGLEYYVLGPKGSKTAERYGGKVEAIINERTMPGIIMENYMRTTNDYKSIYPFIETIAKGYCNGIANFLDGKACQGEATTTSVSSQQPQGIAACKFYRNDQIPDSGDCPPLDQGFRCEQALDFKSPLLISYIEQASKITGVPAAVLGGLVRIESTVPQQYSATGKSYSISDYTDDDIRAMEEFSKTTDSGNVDTTIGDTNKALCPRSPTGALGITQIQPIGTTGNAPDSVNRGAQFLSQLTGVTKNNDTLSYSEYCNPQYSPVLAGGFILGKLGINAWTTPSNPQEYEALITKVARLYYGDDGQTGSYQNSLWRSVESCKEGSAGSLGNLSGSAKSNALCVKVGNPAEEKPAICNTPTPGGPRPEAPPAEGELQTAIQQQFGISMLGFDNQHLQWTWEKLWEVSNTKFSTLVNGTVIQAIPNISGTAQDAYRHINLGQFPEETAFKHILTHELGHVIRNYAGRENAQESAFLNAYAKEKGVSYYAKNAEACTGSDSISEDYAEMIAYYLNPGTPVASYLKCYQATQNKFTQQEFPLHYLVARDVLGAY